MDIREFIQMIAAAVRDEVRSAPPKKFSVKRREPNGREHTQQDVSLPELLAENTDQMKVNAALTRELIKELQEQRKFAQQLQRQRNGFT